MPSLALVGLFAVQLVGGLLGVLVALVAGALVGVAAEVHGRLHPTFAQVADRFAYTLWILPGLLVAALGLGLASLEGADPAILRILPLVGVGLSGLAVIAQERELASEEPSGWPRLLLSLLTYITAFALFTIVYQTKVRSLVTATSIATLSILLSLIMLRSAPSPRRRTVLYAALIGLVIGEVTWALNYWVVLALVGGAVLLLMFYVLVGLVEGILHGELTRRVLIEYCSVGLLGFLLILSTGPWRP